MRRPLLAYCVGIFAASWALQIAGLYAVGGNVENTAITSKSIHAPSPKSDFLHNLAEALALNHLCMPNA